MSATILKAHYDGRNIVLDEPYDLPANKPLLVQVITPDAVHADWQALGVRGLARAYGDDEPEYTTADLKPG